MSRLTIFLGKLIGIYLIVVSLALLAGRAPMLSQSQMIRDHPALLTAGLIALAVSLALIRAHNIWSGGVLPVLVTLVGWILLIISLALLFIAPESLFSVTWVIKFRPSFHIYAWILLVLGVCMTYLGNREKARATDAAAQEVGLAHTEMT